MGAEFFAAGGLQPGVERHGEKAAAEAEQHDAEHHGIGLAAQQEAADAAVFVVVRAVHEGNEQQAEYGHAHRAHGHPAEVEPAVAEFGAQHRAATDADGKQGEHQVEYIVVAAQVQFGEGGQLGGVHRADKPKPGNADDGGVDFAVGKGLFQNGFGIAHNVPVDFCFRGFRCHARHKQAGGEAANSDDEQENGYRGAADAGQNSAQNLAEQDGEKRAAFHQAVARNQLVFVQIIGQHGVFQRAEQGGMQAHQENAEQQKQQRLAEETRRGQQHNQHFGHLHRHRHAAAVEFVAQLAGEGGKQEKGQHKQKRAHVNHLRRFDEAVFAQTIKADHGGQRDFE